MKIGLLSDTHGYLDERIFEYFTACDEIWHAGDIGTVKVADQLAQFKPFRAVYGNVDGQEIRITYPQDIHFQCEGLEVWMTHIGGRPPRYNSRVLQALKQHAPDIFICGHSHILKVAKDDTFNMLYLNPGAAGRQGFHKVRTLVRFSVTHQKIENMEVIELGKK